MNKRHNPQRYEQHKMEENLLKIKKIVVSERKL